MKLNTLFENYNEYRDSRWVHYTSHEMLTIRTRSSHTDPSGIYFFPESHNPEASMWHQKKYKFTIVLKDNAKVLDLPDMPDAEIDRMVAMGDVKDQYEGYIGRYPPDTHSKKVDMAWEQMKNGGFGFSAKWNSILRQLGYNAVFDDKGIIHHAEPIQLLVLDPRIITVVSRETQKLNTFANMQLVMKELVDVCKEFGEVEVQPPRKTKESSWSRNMELRGRVEVKRSKDNYASFNITQGNESFNTHIIHIGLSWSSPRLNYGVGASFDSAKKEWQFKGLESIRRDLAQIFA